MDDVAYLLGRCSVCDLGVDCLHMEKENQNQRNQNLHQKSSFQLSPLCAALPESGRGLGPPVNLLSGEKTRRFPLSTHLKSFKQPFPLFSPPWHVSVCFYRWLYWLSQLFQETQLGWALLFSTPSSLGKVTFLQAHMVRQHILGTEGTWGRALARPPRVAGCTSTCLKDGAIWVDNALLEHIIHCFVIPNGDQG